MCEVDMELPAERGECRHRVNLPPPRPFFTSMKSKLKETFFPDDPFKQFKNQPSTWKIVMGLQYFLPILQWAPSYSFNLFKSDLIAGVTIASLAIPQGISYAKLALLPPILGLYSSFVPPLIYAVMGSSRDLAVGTVAVPSLLIASMLSREVSPTEQPTLYMHMAFTATFFAGVLQMAMGLLRLGFIVDFLSHATTVGFMAGAATVISLQQMKWILGLHHFTKSTDLPSVIHSIFNQTHQWRWQTVVLGGSFLSFLLFTRYFSKRRRQLFWIFAIAPLTSIVCGSFLVYLTHAEKHGVEVIGHLKKGLNPPSMTTFVFKSPYLLIALKIGALAGVIGLSEGIAVGRIFALYKSYHIDGNKEMIAFGAMNIVGSCFSCYLTTGPFSRSAVNFNAGCKTAMSNIVMATTVMITLLFLTQLFRYTPLVVLSSVILVSMFGLVDYEAIIHLWKVDKVDFFICTAAFFGVILDSVEVGLIISVIFSMIRLILFISRPRTCVLGNIPNSTIYRSVDQYPFVYRTPGILILHVDAPIYFANANYLRQRISRWIIEEEDRGKLLGEIGLQYVILDMSGVLSIDTSGINMLEEVRESMIQMQLKLVIVNPRGEVIQKMSKTKYIEGIDQGWIYLTIAEAVERCNLMIQESKLEKHNLTMDMDSV